MLSVARVDDSDLGSQNTSRYSASLYNEYELGEDRKFYNSLIFGLITHYDSASTLISFGEEFLFRGGSHSLWGRLEVLQRTPAELEILNISDQNQGRWVEALTVGYTHSLKKWEDVELGLGASVTVDFLPSALSGGYGGSSPFTGKVFLQLGGSKMWSL